MIKLICPKCGAEAKLSLAEGDYSGPRRCWKCHEYFMISIVNNRVVSCEPLSDEEYERQFTDNKSPGKGYGRVEASEQKDSDEPRLVPERERDYSRPFNYGVSSGQSEPEKQASIFPPGGFPSFAPGETGYKKSEKPSWPLTPPEKQKDYGKPPVSKEPSARPDSGKAGSVYPPDRFRTFVPMEEIEEEPTEKPKKPKDPPDRFNLFIPPAT